jgi:hypothetical protein
MNLKIDLLPIAMNTCMTFGYAYKGNEPGKTVYWLGATVITLGLYMMKG